ncbi:MAG: ABC transporter ATP-binding protein [Roseivirga sp.]
MIQINQLSYRYSRKRQILSDLDLELPTGKIYGLLGKNGAGKSTLIRNIAGTLFPTKGSCRVLGYEPKQRQIDFLKELFFVPEECFLPNLAIRQFIDIYAPYYPNFDRGQYEQYLKQFAIDSGQHLQALSFGQKKKAMIGFALSANTRLLIMDEPTNGLDIPSKVLFRNMIKEAMKPDRLVLITSHQVRDLDELITDLIIMDQGEILLHETKEAIAHTLRFELTEAPSKASGLLYEEKQANGWAQILKNPMALTSPVDVELLFNAMLNSRETINAEFAPQPQPELI